MTCSKVSHEAPRTTPSISSHTYMQASKRSRATHFRRIYKHMQRAATPTRSKANFTCTYSRLRAYEYAFTHTFSTRNANLVLTSIKADAMLHGPLATQGFQNTISGQHQSVLERKMFIYILNKCNDVYFKFLSSI